MLPITQGPESPFEISLKDAKTLQDADWAKRVYKVPSTLYFIVVTVATKIMCINVRVFA